VKEWTISIEGASDRADEAMADLLVEELNQYSAAAGYSNGRIGVTMSVTADTPDRAVSIAIDAFMRVVATPVTRVEAELAA
jgi:uncharacterized protein (DUF1501 family)